MKIKYFIDKREEKEIDVPEYFIAITNADSPFADIRLCRCLPKEEKRDQKIMALKMDSFNSKSFIEEVAILHATFFNTQGELEIQKLSKEDFEKEAQVACDFFKIMST